MLVPLLLLGLATMTFGAAVASGTIELGVGALSDSPPWLIALSVALATAGALAGWLLYRGGPRDERALGPARSGFGVDALYGRTAIPVFIAIARTLEVGAERTNGMALDLVGRIAMAASTAARRVQSGYLRSYETLLLAGAVALLAYWSIR
jgi:NADH:ubiquinone oxidoreductase subunit 5 (subunit L)/multisubunit Na+/H+ antiporter MnhA subunit